MAKTKENKEIAKRLYDITLKQRQAVKSSEIGRLKEEYNIIVNDIFTKGYHLGEIAVYMSEYKDLSEEEYDKWLSK